jgi:hypothetical protein
VTIFLRKMKAHDVIEGREPGPWDEDDYAVLEGTLIGRIYRDRVPGGEMRWRWFLPDPGPTGAATQQRRLRHA